MTNRRDAILGLALGASALSSSSAPIRAQPASAGPQTTRSVRDFGAVGDGRTDDTAAFNAATRATATWREGDVPAAIHVPPGTYRIDGTIRLRKGQHLSGSGEASLIDATHARGTTLTLGSDGAGRTDPGGFPVGVSRLRFLGGSASEPLIRVAAAGFSLSHLFITAPGTGVFIAGGDGVLTDITIDQALRGLVFEGAQNVIVQGLVSYLANYALTLDARSSDIVVSQAVIAYSRIASVLFAEGAQGIRSVRFGDCNLLSNEGYDGFLGHVHVRSEQPDAQFANCSFRNAPGFAVRQEAGSGAQLAFTGCVFDGSRSRDDYNASATAGGILTGAGARIHLADCHFRNLSQEAVRIGPYLDRLVLSGGSIRDCAGHSIVSAADAGGELAVRAVDGFGRRFDRGALVLPWRGAATHWRVTARTSSGDGAIASADCAVVRSGRRQVVLLQPTASLGADLSLSAGFGEGPGGPNAIAGAESGFLCLSTSRRDVVWSAETG